VRAAGAAASKTMANVLKRNMSTSGMRKASLRVTADARVRALTMRAK
jgi:hypothetical protein